MNPTSSTYQTSSHNLVTIRYILCNSQITETTYDIPLSQGYRFPSLYYPFNSIPSHPHHPSTQCSTIQCIPASNSHPIPKSVRIDPRGVIGQWLPLPLDSSAACSSASPALETRGWRECVSACTSKPFTVLTQPRGGRVCAPRSKRRRVS